MKKKIKDLSEKQIDNICKKYEEKDEKGWVHCFECPLVHPIYPACLRGDKKWFLERYGNKEIEVDEDEERT